MNVLRNISQIRLGIFCEYFADPNAYRYTNMHATCIHKTTHTYMHTVYKKSQEKHTCTITCIHTQTFPYVHTTRTNANAHTHACTHRHAHVHTYISHTNIQTHTLAHTHT